MKFNEIYDFLYKDEQLVTESFNSIINSPRTLYAAALLLGITHFYYTIPKLRELVKQKSQQLSPPQIQKVITEVPKIVETPLVNALMDRLSEIDVSIPKIDKKPVDDFLPDAYQYIKKHEGVYNQMYKDIYGNWTIGIGHLVKPEEYKKFEGKTLTDEEVEKIFTQDIQNKLSLIKKHFGEQFDKYSKNMKIAILDGYFRGDLSGSPKTRLLLKSRKFPEAAKQYLANKEYEKAKKSGSGVAKRMETNAKIFANEI